MIFGIKTKKDKQIEELQVINKELQNALEEEKMRKQSTQFIRVPILTSPIGASYILDKYEESIIPESYIKSILARSLSEELIKRGLPIEKVKLDNGDVEYRVRLKVILNDIYRN
ncbi:MAG: hypothetical protein ACLR1A_07785 [Eubacterium ventriosum]